ncbi:hypothetical protein [Niabella ginsengisoli]|uniref:Uncharacterized protein n=1 Tax=Niabella ginsengisoli TaxID=522298 RepID=A0ABS9SNS5_9BACT|nr:hypothetical protein [Niabella ginsengisoli]MCH5600010.1 hypothetical protein [Niabella ginsengisoli]
MLTQEQIQEIENLCFSEGVYFYDVRMEMVDHISQAIEDILKQQAKMSFEEALKTASQEVGVYGFKYIVEEKEKEIRQAVRQRQFKLFRTFFTWPKIAGCLLLFVLVIIPYYYFELSAKTYVNISRLTMCIILLFWLFLRMPFKKAAKKLLTVKVINEGVLSAQWLLGVFGLGSLFTNNTEEGWTNAGWFAVLVSVITASIILLSLAEIMVHRAIYKSSRRNYPTVFTKY